MKDGTQVNCTLIAKGDSSMTLVLWKEGSDEDQHDTITLSNEDMKKFLSQDNLSDNLTQ